MRKCLSRMAVLRVQVADLPHLSLDPLPTVSTGKTDDYFLGDNYFSGGPFGPPAFQMGNFAHLRFSGGSYFPRDRFRSPAFQV
jgi:hypothetical protein